MVAIVISFAICVLYLISSGMSVERGDMTGFIAGLIFAAVSGFITYTLLTLSN